MKVFTPVYTIHKVSSLFSLKCRGMSFARFYWSLAYVSKSTSWYQPYSRPCMSPNVELEPQVEPWRLKSKRDWFTVRAILALELWSCLPKEIWHSGPVSSCKSLLKYTFGLAFMWYSLLVIFRRCSKPQNRLDIGFF